MAFKFKDLMIYVLPKAEAADASPCPAPSAGEEALYCAMPSLLCPLPSVPAERMAGICIPPSATPLNLCLAPSAGQQDVGPQCVFPTAFAQQAQAQAAAGFDETSLEAMAALKAELQKALAQVEEHERALQGEDRPKS